MESVAFETINNKARGKQTGNQVSIEVWPATSEKSGFLLKTTCDEVALYKTLGLGLGLVQRTPLKAVFDCARMVSAGRNGTTSFTIIQKG